MSLGFVGQTLDVIVDGIVESVRQAHNNMRQGKLSYTYSYLYNTSINRSPSAYLNNPEAERKQ